MDKPPQFWSWGNIQNIVKEAGAKDLLEVDEGCLSLDRVDMIRAIYENLSCNQGRVL